MTPRSLTPPSRTPARLLLGIALVTVFLAGCRPEEGDGDEVSDVPDATDLPEVWGDPSPWGPDGGPDPLLSCARTGEPELIFADGSAFLGVAFVDGEPWAATHQTLKSYEAGPQRRVGAFGYAAAIAAAGPGEWWALGMTSRRFSVDGTLLEEVSLGGYVTDARGDDGAVAALGWIPGEDTLPPGVPSWFVDGPLFEGALDGGAVLEGQDGLWTEVGEVQLVRDLEGSGEDLWAVDYHGAVHHKPPGGEFAVDIGWELNATDLDVDATGRAAAVGDWNGRVCFVDRSTEGVFARHCVPKGYNGGITGTADDWFTVDRGARRYQDGQWVGVPDSWNVVAVLPQAGGPTLLVTDHDVSELDGDWNDASSVPIVDAARDGDRVVTLSVSGTDRAWLRLYDGPDYDHQVVNLREDTARWPKEFEFDAVQLDSDGQIWVGGHGPEGHAVARWSSEGWRRTDFPGNYIVYQLVPDRSGGMYAWAGEDLVRIDALGDVVSIPRRSVDIAIDPTTGDLWSSGARWDGAQWVEGDRAYAAFGVDGTGFIVDGDVWVDRCLP